MLTNEQAVRVHSDVVCTELTGGETVLLHMGTHTYFTLNQTGTFIWSLLEQQQSLDEIGRALESKFDVGLERAQQSVRTLVEELVAQKLVTLTTEPQVA